MGLALIKPFFDRVWSNPQTALVRVPGLKEDTELSLMSEQVDEIEEQMPYLEEIPLLDREGRITRVLTKNPRQVESNEFAWWNLDKGFLPSKFRKYDKIYLSSLENPDMLDFYKAWRELLPLEVLNKDNVRKAFQRDNCLLLYAADVFPECNKMSIWEFWDMAARYWIEKKLSFVIVKNEWAHLLEKEADSLHNCIRWFDRGYKTVAVTNEAGIYQGAIISTTFGKDFPSRHICRWSNIFVLYQDNHKRLKRSVVEMCFGTARRDIPLVLDGKVVGMGRLCNSNVEDVMGEEPFFPKLQWNLINEEVVRQFFSGYKKILLSSEEGDLKEFKERFESVLDIVVYEDALLDSYLSGDFDVLICGTDIWPNSHAFKYTARSLYVNLLSKVLSDYLNVHNVAYYYLSISRPQMNGNVRMSHSANMEHMPGVAVHDKSVQYYTHADGDIVSCGERVTVGTPAQYKNSVYFYGACTVEGAFVNSCDTIESLFQSRINKDNLPIRAVNRGCAGVDYEINALHMIASTDYKEGDTIVHISRMQNRSSMLAQNGKMFHAEDIFEPCSVQPLKVYADNKSPGHLTVEGNRLVADYLYKRMKGEFTKVIKDRRPVPSFASSRLS